MLARPDLISPAVEKLKELQKQQDIEAAHSEADGVLCDLLELLGYQDVVREWTRIKKWYA